jgi:hypothetical protein
MMTLVFSVVCRRLMQITTRPPVNAPSAPMNTPGSKPAVNGRA